MMSIPQPLQSSFLLQPENIDLLIDRGEKFTLQKHDNSTTVGIIKGTAFGLTHDLWIKRLNYKGFFDFLLKRCLASRAKRLYNINLRLYEKGLPVAKPLSYFEPSFKLKHSFFISSVIEDADNLADAFIKKKFIDPREMTQPLAETIANWHLYGAVHGDLKWSNILFQRIGNKYRFFLVDLDQSRLYEKPFIKGIMKDLVRFYRYGLELGASDWVDSRFLAEYLTSVPVEIKTRINTDRVRNIAHEEWLRKGQRKLI